MNSPSMSNSPTNSQECSVPLKRCSSYVGAGIILLRYPSHNSEPEFLLLKGADTGIWSFPKGHPEANDKNYPFYTAIRETSEETGFQYDVDYTVMGDVIRFGKRFYWYGVVSRSSMYNPISLMSREHAGYGWFRVCDLMKLTANYDVRSWVKKMYGEPGHYNSYMMYKSLYEDGIPISPDMSSYTTPDMHSNALDHNASSAL